ncbi:caspase domain-containing protein [Kitasatospora sp. NPDC058162]|uniref:caspase family protein n=1 Tax=Kitasatospora sp. NPDC058162 TaxID=3346362 RepID=UPI0036DB25C0
MRTVFALLVGINDYSALGRASLQGCVNDASAAGRWLDAQVTKPVVRTLLDTDATVRAVTDGIRGHLGQAGPQDTALLWFSGHGTEFDATAEQLKIESTGRCQALVCADGPLLDKELGALLDEVAARGAHVVAVLDCCFSGGATRDAEGSARLLPPDPSWGALATARDLTGPAAGPGHVLLAASRLNQPAFEDWFDGRRHGVFTHALLGALGQQGGPELSYRRLMAAVQCRVQGSGERQHPVLLPLEAGGPADRPFLGGAVRAPSPHLLRHGASGWEVDCGTVHGLRAGPITGGTEFSVEPGPDSQDRHLLTAREVRVDRTLVEPSDWSPDPALSYPVTLSALALPPVSALVEALERPAVAAELTDALRTARSPLLHLVDDPRDAPGTLLRVVLDRAEARVLFRDGSPAVPALPWDGTADARRIVDCLVHLAGWHQLRDLANPDPSLGSHVRVEVTPWDGGGPIMPEGSGEILRSYGRGPGGWQEPRVSVRIHNRSTGKALWCVLLNLTDSYASRSVLFPGAFIAPGGTGYALDGDPVHLSLPSTRPVRPGAYVRDWLKLIVAEGELNTVPFQFGPWDPTLPADRQAGRSADGVFRPLAPGGSRDMLPGRPAPSPGRWAALTLPLRTVVPG